MSVTLNDVNQRVGHRVRVKIADPNSFGGQQPATERDAILVRVDQDTGETYFSIGVAIIHVPLTQIISLEGGLGPPVDQGPSKGTAF